MAKVYLTYNGNNSDAVHKLATLLKKSGLSPSEILIRKVPPPEMGGGGEEVFEWAKQFYEFYINHKEEVSVAIGILGKLFGYIQKVVAYSPKIPTTVHAIHIDIESFNSRRNILTRNRFYYSSLMTARDFVRAWALMQLFLIDSHDSFPAAKNATYTTIDSQEWIYQPKEKCWRQAKHKFTDAFMQKSIKW